MILKDVPIRRGIAFLEPSNVVLKGYMTEELDANREADFARGLRMRLGQPELDPQEEPNARDDPPGPPPPGGLVGAQRNGNEPQRAPLRDVSKDDPIARRPPHQPAREELEPPTRRRVPAASMDSASSTVVSPYFSNMVATSTTIASSSDLATLRLSPVRRDPLPSSRTAVEDSFDFSDDMPIDEAFLEELEAAEQAALNTVQQRERDNSQASFRRPRAAAAAPDTGHSEVIVIDSDEDEKENLAPVVTRRVRRRMAMPDPNDSDVIVIE